MPGSLSVRRRNAKRAAQKRQITKGQSLSTYRPGFFEGIYNAVDAPVADLYRRLGMSEQDAYQASKNLSGGVEGVTGLQSVEQSLRNFRSGNQRPEDYVNAALIAAPSFVKPAGRAVGRVVGKVAPDIVKRGAKAVSKFVSRPSYLSDKDAVRYARDSAAASRRGMAEQAVKAEADLAVNPQFTRREEGPFLRVERVGVQPQIVPEVQQARSIDDMRKILKNPETNPAARAADEYTQATFGTPYDVNMPDPGTSFQKQSGIARAFEAADEGSPEYKQALFERYGQLMPQVVEAAGAQNYDQLTEAAYRQLAKEAEDQFNSLPIRTSYHYGPGEYATPSAMIRDVLGEGNLNVFRGGDPHPFLSDISENTGLTANEMFRAAHDFYGHGTRGATFRPGGEELAYASHAQMMSPLAQMALLTETRGQNSLVNYSPLNIDIIPEMEMLKEQIRKARVAARMRGEKFDPSQFAEQNARLRELGAQTVYAPQSPLLLPPEYLPANTAGGIPDYLREVIKPRAPTGPERAVHFSRMPELEATDPAFYGTGHRGEDWAIRGQKGSPAQHTSFYVGPEGTVQPEPVVFEVNPFAHEAELSGLYDIGKDPENIVKLAQAFNDPSGQTAIPDFARLVREYGYKGYIDRFGPQRAANVFDPVSLLRRIEKGSQGWSEGGTVSNNQSASHEEA